MKSLLFLLFVGVACAARVDTQPTLAAEQSVSYLEILSRAQLRANWTGSDAEAGQYNVTFDPATPTLGQNVNVHIIFHATTAGSSGTGGTNLKLSVKASILEAADLAQTSHSKCGAEVAAPASAASACQCAGFQHAVLCPSDPSHCCCGAPAGPTFPSVVPRGTLAASSVVTSVPIGLSACSCGTVVVNTFCPQDPSHCCCKSWQAPEIRPEVNTCACQGIVQVTVCSADPSHCCCSTYVAPVTVGSYNTPSLVPVAVEGNDVVQTSIVGQGGSTYVTPSSLSNNMMPVKVESSGSEVQTTIVSNGGSSTTYPASSGSSNLSPVRIEGSGSEVQTTIVTNPGGTTTTPSGAYTVVPQYGFLQESAKTTKRIRRVRKQVHCDPPRTFQQCGSACQPSCANPSPNCGLACVSGCYCPQNTPIFHDGVCVAIANCPTQYNETQLVNSHSGDPSHGTTVLTKNGTAPPDPVPDSPANFSDVVGYSTDGKALHQVLVVSPTSSCQCQRWAQANGYTYTPPKPGTPNTFNSADVFGIGSPCACEHAYNFDSMRFTEVRSKARTTQFSRLLEFLELADKNAQKISEKSLLVPLNELSLVVLMDSPDHDWTVTISRDMYEKYLARGSTLRVSSQVSDATSGKVYYSGVQDLALQPPALRVFTSCSNVTQGTPFVVYASFTNPLSVPLTNVRVTASSTGFQAQSLRYVSSIPPGQTVALQTNPLTISAAVQHSIVITITSCQLPKLTGAVNVVVGGSILAGPLCNDVKP